MSLFPTEQIINPQGQVTDFERVCRLLEDIKILQIQQLIVSKAILDGSTLIDSDLNITYYNSTGEDVHA